jgi:hypothetical protein
LVQEVVVSAVVVQAEEVVGEVEEAARLSWQPACYPLVALAVKAGAAE